MRSVARNTVLGVLIMSALFCHAQTSTNKGPDVKSLQDAYEKSVARIESDNANAARNQPNAYLKELQQAQQAQQKAGNLDGVTAVGRELDRFKQEQTVPDQPDPALPKEIQKLQTAYKEAASRIELDKSRNIVAATKQYIDRLDALQTSLTKAGRIDEALEVNAEVKGVKSSARVTSAEFAVATGDAAKQQQAAAQPPDDTKKDIRPDKTGSSTNAIADSTEAVIYEGKPFSSEKGQNYKSVTLSTTDRMQGALKLSLAAMLDTQNNMEKSSSAYYSSVTKSKTGSIAYSLRVTLKPSVKSVSFDDSKLVVQYFAKAVADSGKASPKLFDTKTVSLPRIDGTRVIGVEFPVIDVSSSSYKVASRYYGVRSASSGSEFYGFILSVFDSSGALVAQAASNNSLKKLGLAELP